LAAHLLGDFGNPCFSTITVNGEDVSIYLECFGGTIVESPKFEDWQKEEV